MKFATIVLATTLTIVSAGPCDPSDVTNFLPLVTDPSKAKCETAGGFKLMDGMPSTDTLKKICKDDACNALMTTVAGLKPKDCDLAIGGATLNVYRLMNDFKTLCSAPAPAPVNGPSVAPAPAPVTPSVAPAPGGSNASAPSSNTTPTSSGATQQQQQQQQQQKPQC